MRARIKGSDGDGAGATERGVAGRGSASFAGSRGAASPPGVTAPWAAAGSCRRAAHAKAKPAAKALAAVAAFLRGLTKNAEQLTRLQTWRAILSRAFQAFLNGRMLRAPHRLAHS